MNPNPNPNLITRAIRYGNGRPGFFQYLPSQQPNQEQPAHEINPQQNPAQP